MANKNFNNGDTNNAFFSNQPEAPAAPEATTDAADRQPARRAWKLPDGVKRISASAEKKIADEIEKLKRNTAAFDGEKRKHRVQLVFQPSLYLKAKQHAIKRGMSLNHFVELAVKAALDDTGK